MMTTNWLVTMIILMIEMTNMPLTIDDKDDKDDKLPLSDAAMTTFSDAVMTTYSDAVMTTFSDAVMTTSSDAGRVNQLR